MPSTGPSLKGEIACVWQAKSDISTTLQNAGYSFLVAGYKTEDLYKQAR